MIKGNSEALSVHCPISSGGPVGHTCLGRACMAWRPTDAKNGYCGMAGTPRELLYAIPAGAVSQLFKEITEAQRAAWAADDLTVPPKPPVVDSRLGEE